MPLAVPLLLQIFSRSNQWYQKSLCTKRKRARTCAVICAMTSPLYPLCGWSESLITGAFIRLFVSWKESPILNHFNLPPFFQFPPSLCGDTKTLQAIDALTLRSSPAARLTSVSDACGFFRFRSQAHPSGVWAICAFSQQVITECSLSSHSARLGCLCWCGQVQRDGNSQRAHVMA